MSRDIHSVELCDAIEKWVVNHEDNPSTKELISALEELGWTDVDLMITDAMDADRIVENNGRLYVKGH